ncbi:MAG: HisA/HisF-related TIM barrel protein [Caldilineaceae bacterium]
MIIYPAIDIKQGRVVRTRQSSAEDLSDLDDDPIPLAQSCAAQGAEWLYLVNLDGASAATKYIPIGSTLPSPDPLTINLQVLRDIRERIQQPIQFCGGLRTLDSIRQAIELGADRVILGSVVLEKPNLLCEAIRQWGSERIVVSLHARDGIVAMPHSNLQRGMDSVEMGHRMYAMGVRKVLYSNTDPLSTINVEAMARLGDSTGLQIIANGVGCLHDIELLKEQEYYNIDGAVIHLSQIPHAFDLKHLISLGKAPLIRHSAGIIPYRQAEEGLQILIIYNYALEQWQLPRGHLEPSETLAECAQREFSSQTNLQLAEFHPAPGFPLQFMRRFRDYHINRLITFFLGRVHEGEIVLSNENHCEALWASPDEALTLIAETGSEQLPVLESALEHLTLVIE